MTPTAPNPLDIRLTEEDGRGRFTGWVGKDRAAVVAFSRLKPDLLLVEHVQTFPGYQGQGNGERMVRHVAEWARENDHKLMPLCPFARSIFERDPSIGDVRAGL